MTRGQRLGTWARYLVAMALACSLGGCVSSVLPMPAAPPAQYALTADGDTPGAPSTDTAPARPRTTLVVNLPRAAPGYDTVRIAYVSRPLQIDYFAHSQWVDTPSNMLAPMMVRAIGRTGAFHAVLGVPTSAVGQLRLESELVRLQQDFTATPSQVRLTLHATLVDVATRRVIASREFDARVPASTDDPYGGVTAAQQAASQVVAALAAFCANTPIR